VIRLATRDEVIDLEDEAKAVLLKALIEAAGKGPMGMAEVSALSEAYQAIHGS
jgi:hypothetical protein